MGVLCGAGGRQISCPRHGYLIKSAVVMIKRLLLISSAALLLTAAYERINTPVQMAEAARAYLDSLSPELRAQTMMPFDGEERVNWRFIPVDDRKGVALREMDKAQKHLAEALLSAALSNQGIIKAHTIMSLDQVLLAMEGPDGFFERDPEKYYVSIFGEPSETGRWGFRFEGHHISLNFTIDDGQVASSPNFFGSNPALVMEGPRAGLRALSREEDIARDLMMAFTAEQRAVAIVNEQAPRDITTSNSRTVMLEGDPQGIRYGDLTGVQKEILDALVEEYAANFPEQIAQMRMEQFRANQDNLYFAWMGGVNPGEGHYYMIRTPVFLIEYDNTQNGNNHVHSVWRDYAGDFGDDMLAAHYEASPHDAALAE